MNRRQFIPSLLAAVPLLLGFGWWATRPKEDDSSICPSCEMCRQKGFAITATARTLDDAKGIAEAIRNSTDEVLRHYRMTKALREFYG